jgi:hypothetical protein
MEIEQSRKAGLASGLARQSPELIADKARAIELHKQGLDTGAISRALPTRQRTEIRRWLIAAGCYQTKGRGKSQACRFTFYRAVSLIASQYARDLAKVAQTDNESHWRRHPACGQYAARAAYYADHEASKDRSKAMAKREYYGANRHKLKRLLHARIYNAVRRHGNGKRAARTMDLIGCTIPELRAHIQSTFKAGMGWHNHGTGHGKWHIDHIRPCASFDLTIDTQQRACFHWRNLQALWGKYNIAKSDNWQA